MTTEDLWRLVRRYWTMLLACTVAGVGLAWAYTATRTPVYTADAAAYVVVQDPTGQDVRGATRSGAAYSNSLLAQQKAKGWVELVTSTAVAQRVVDRLKLEESPQQLASSLTAKLTQDTPSIKITARSSSPRGAQQIANAVVTATGEEARRLDGLSSAATIRLVSSAQLPSRPSSPRPERNLPLGGVLGAAAGLGLAAARRRSDTRLRTPEDVEASCGAGVLAVVPDTDGLDGGSRRAGRGSFQTREALRQLRTNLRFVDVDDPPRSIVVTSARMGEGKSTTAANLARVLAESGEQVLLIDADLRRPSVATVFDLDPVVGLTQVLSGAATLAAAVQHGDTANLTVLTAGQIPPNPTELLGSRRMEQLITEAARTHFVILDAPPLLPVTDAALLTARAGGALLVVAAGQTREEHLRHAVRNLQRVEGKVLGAVLNRVSTSRFNRIVHGEDQYGYGAYETYGDEYVADPAPVAAAPAPAQRRAS